MTPTPAPVPVTTRVDNHDRDRDKGAQSATTTPGGNNNGGSGNKKRSQNKMPSGGHAQSLNHLLNFTLPPRQPQGLPPLPRRSRKTASAAAYGVWNKESEYLLALNGFLGKDLYDVYHYQSSSMRSIVSS